MERLCVFAERNEVCAILTLVVDHKVERFPMVEWYRFEGDRIAFHRARLMLRGYLSALAGVKS